MFSHKKDDTVLTNRVRSLLYKTTALVAKSHTEMRCLPIVCLLVIGRVSGRASSTIPHHLEVEEFEPKIAEIETLPEEEQPELKIEVPKEEPSEEPQTRVFYNGSQVWKTIVDTSEKVHILAQLRDQHHISMWGGNTTSIDIMVKPESLKLIDEKLKDFGINYKVIIEDLQKAIDIENPEEDDDELNHRDGNPISWKRYYTFDQHQAYIDYLVNTFPNLCSKMVIGQSVQGRPITVLKISNGNPGNKAIWMDGGIHAREWISPASVTFIVQQIASNFDSQPSYIQNIDWYIAPVLNPDGYIFSHTRNRLWRKNRRQGPYGGCPGVDLNRNFGYKWGGRGASTQVCAETFGGRSAFSEPETASVKNFITGNKNIKWKAYVSFHSYGQYILYPWGYDRVVPPDYKDLQAVGDKAAGAMRSLYGSYYKVGPAGQTLYPAAGGSDDWAKGVAGFKYAYTIELRDQGTYGFVLPAHFIEPTAQEALQAIKVIAEAASQA